MDTELEPRNDAASRPPARHGLVSLGQRITKLEWGAAGVVAVVLVGLIVAEPEILEAPFENSRTLLFTLGGTALALVGLIAMLRLRVPPIARLAVLGIPFLAVNWWLLSPYFIDDVADEGFSISIAQAAGGPSAATDETVPTAVPATQPPAAPAAVGSSPKATVQPAAPAPSDPVLLGSGTFRGLAGHRGTGDSGIFQIADGPQVLRLENLDIQNGPDLRLYIVPGADQTRPGPDSLNLGDLRGNVGNLTYDLPPTFPIAAGSWTVLVWCEAFSVEFVGATVTVA